MGHTDSRADLLTAPWDYPFSLGHRDPSQEIDRVPHGRLHRFTILYCIGVGELRHEGEAYPLLDRRRRIGRCRGAWRLLRVATSCSPRRVSANHRPAPEGRSRQITAHREGCSAKILAWAPNRATTPSRVEDSDNGSRRRYLTSLLPHREAQPACLGCGQRAWPNRSGKMLPRWADFATSYPVAGSR